MFLGHFGLAFAAKRVAPRPSLGTLVLAAQWPDGVWPILLLAGIEEVRIAPVTAVTPLDFVWYPYSHSLGFDLAWACLLAGVYFVVRRDARGAVWVGALVLSHWVLDVIAHRPDMPLWPGGPRFGLGLWNSLPATLAAEAIAFSAGAVVYSRATAARDALGRWAWMAFVIVLAVLYVASVVGPPPPSVPVLAASSLAGWLLVAWAYVIDRHRTLLVRNPS